MRILFFGLPLAAVLLAKEGHVIVHACPCRPHCPGERRLRRELGEARVEVKPDLRDARTVDRLAALSPDLLVSWFWTTRIPAALLRAPRLGTLGVHPSLLPRHRGPDPYFWAIESGDAETGVTAHVLGEKYDTGAVYAQRRLTIDPRWNAWTLAKKLDRPSLALLRETVRAFASGRAPVPVPQEESLATDAPAPDEALLEIDWQSEAAHIERRIRAAAPEPGAYTFFGDEAVTLTRVRVRTDAPRALAPGEAWVTERDGRGAPLRAAVRTLDGAVDLLEGWRESEEEGRCRLDAKALATLIGSSAHTV